MSSSLNISDENQPSAVLRVGLSDNNQLNVLKSKENIRKTICSKTLKRKLKKYKVRRDGKEDPDVINVSKALISSLRIKSPNYQEISVSRVSQDSESTPRNYLFKMVNQKKSCSKSDIKVVNNDSNSIPMLDSTESVTIDLKNSDTKQMNAFKLMMDSRNKSLGSNSPGKEMCKNENEFNEIIKKRELKAKRILSLERMAQEKGSVKNKEIEEFREECVKSQMLKRAERLKLMIEGSHFKSQEKICNNVPKKCFSEDLKDNDVKPCHNSREKQKGTLKLFNFLSESEPCLTKTKNINKVTEEEREFLNKLSPSIKKKENMLSYFKKLPKEEPLEDEGCNSVIKVNTPKAKMKSKHSKIIINSEEMGHISNDIGIIKARKKRKRDRKKNEKNVNEEDEKEKSDEEKVEKEKNEKEKEEKTSFVVNNNERPKRNAKKPAKYTDDILFTSSDEELHIFTPKKKRILKSEPIIKKYDSTNSKEVVAKKKQIVYAVNSNAKVKNKSVEKDVCRKSIANKLDNKSQEQSKNIKLAPIFVTKVPQNSLELDAKQKFLQSGVPDILKVKSQQSNTALFTNTFHTVVHIQQLEKTLILSKDWIPFIQDDSHPKFEENNDSTLFEKLIAQAHCYNTNTMYSKPKPDKLLKMLKNAYPKFPVYRTYQLLKSKCQGEIKESNTQELDNSIEIANSLIDTSNENPERLIWNDKYRATSSKQIIGNFESVKELKRWLESWTENISKDKNNHNYESDLSDFCFSDTDTDSKDTFRHSNNILVITGPVGTGKTSSVYAVASELAIKVIEVNASSKRTGKIMLQDLQEATQSHKVNRGSSRVDSSQKSQEDTITIKKRKKNGRPKKTYERSHRKSSENRQKSEKVEKEVMSQELDKCSQEISRTGMSLILIDDADIVFEQDDGFCSAVSQLIQCSKRPVILITSSLKCPHLQKFLMCGKIIHMHPLLPRMLGTWLDIMCIADTSFCYPGLGSKILNYYNGDIRKTINFLQYFMTSDKYLYQIEDQTLSQVANTCKGNIDDENSSTSWADSEAVDSYDCEKNIDANALKSFTDNNLALSLPNVSTHLFNVWWNMSGYLGDLTKALESELLFKKVNYPKRIAKTLDCISFIDALNIKKDNLQLDLASNPWHTHEVASVLENESLDYYNKWEDVISDISNELMIRAMSIHGLSSVSSPTMSEQRARNKIVARHKILTSHLYPSTMLDKKALALDYWPFCRTICRLEKTKTDINLKRNNRFCHYMKTINVLCKNDFFDSLSESLS